MATKVARVSGVMMLGVFLINVYIGLYDDILATVPLHYDLNWLIAVVSLVAAILLLVKPTSITWVALGGIVWPVVYVASLAVDVWFRMCPETGGTGPTCWPSRMDAFRYLVLNDQSIPNGYGWSSHLSSFTMPVGIGLLFIAFVFAIIAVLDLRKIKLPPSAKPQPEQKPVSAPP